MIEMETTEVRLLGGNSLTSWREDDATIHAQISGPDGELAHAMFTGKDAELTAMVVMMKWAKWNAEATDSER